MKEYLIQNQYRILTILLLLGNAYLLPITADEAYYFSWGKQISLGYFDHPPLIGWVTSWTDPSTVRLPFLMAIWLFIFLAKEEFLGKLLFIPGAHLLLGGALPDTLLVLSGFFVIHSFKKWVSVPSISNAVVLGIMTSMLGYSKFHGILLVLALAIGFWSKRGEWTLYLAMAITALALTPYLVWQSENNWVTFTYHFGERFHYRSIQSLIEFLGITLLLWWPVFNFFNTLKLWSKSLILISLALFGLGAYNGSVEMHWLLVWIWVIPELSMPDSNRICQMTYVLVGVHCLFWIPQFRRYLDLEVHFRPEISNLEADSNVVFLDSYQDAALFEFNTSRKSYSLAHPGIRLSQYNLRPYPFDGKEVVVYNRMKIGEKLEDTPFYFTRAVLFDLSNMKYTRNSDRIEFDRKYIPLGYNWILYTYRDAIEVSRTIVCSGKSEPIVEIDNKVRQFLTLEKNWLPSGLWIPLQ